MNNENTSAIGIVVPIDVTAYCVGLNDNSASFAGATIDYSQLTAKNPAAYLGGSATRGFQDAVVPLESGVHLHWALPDALTRAKPAAGSLDFPAVPNRWLVTRLVVTGDTLTPSSFIVESDCLSDSTDATTKSYQIPVKAPATSGSPDGVPDFMVLGQSWSLASYQPGSGRSFKEATGAEFHAASNGVLSFAAYYPESRRCFGFHDPLSDIGVDDKLTQLMYVVTGWFDNAANDPAVLAASELNQAGEPMSLAQSRKWLCEATPAYTLYSGMVQQVAWNPQQQYIPTDAPTICAGLAIANTPSEALAAYFTQSLHPDIPFAENLLTAFQSGLWEKLSQPDPDMLAKIGEFLHDAQFRKIESGTIYSLRQQVGGHEQEAIALPFPIAAALNALNKAAGEQLEVSNQVNNCRWQVFANWYRYFHEEDQGNLPAIFNHLNQKLKPLWADLQAAAKSAGDTLVAATDALVNLLKTRADLSLRAEPGPRYFQPTDPVVLLSAPELLTPSRYGGDGAHRSDGMLVCRATDTLVSGVTIGASTRTAAVFATAAQLDAANLPYADDCARLLAEACLLNPAVAAAWSRIAQTQLDLALTDLLAGLTASNLWTIPTGLPPSPVAITLWTTNPWLPLFLTWEIGYAPLHATDNGTALTDYDPAFFSANFAIDPENASFVVYAPDAGGINIDPTTANYNKTYTGSTLLSHKAAAKFENQITEYLQTTPDSTLLSIQAGLQASAFMVQPLSGFTEALLNRQMLMQVTLVAPPGASWEARHVTSIASGILNSGGDSGTYHVTPAFGDPFSPIRAGYLSLASENLTLVAVDAYGQRRTIGIGNGNSYVAASMSASVPLPSTTSAIAFTPPRLAQPSRLLFQWLSAADGTTAEYNGHPATSPICGWLMPNHLTCGFFVYDADGKPLGSLFMAGDDPGADSTIVWRGAPGSDADINCGIENDVTLASVNPQLRALVEQLGTVASPADFQAFYDAVDNAHGSISPANAASDAGLAVLIGRPVALVQASLKLDLMGTPYLNQNQVCLQVEIQQWLDSDAGLSQVKFPVILGDLDRLDDGLIGYFLGMASGGFDLGTFFCDAAPQGACASVVKPEATTLQLMPTPAGNDPSPPQTSTDSISVLMLVDPRAPVHAIPGILPTQSLLVPPYLASAAMGALEFSMPLAPVLRAKAALALPLPSENGYDVAFLEQRKETGSPEWTTTPQIAPSIADALWNYTPQYLTEGWLRFKPAVLTAALVNSNGQALAQSGVAQPMRLMLCNRRPVPITFRKSLPVAEGSTAEGSIFYIHFGALVAQSDLSAMSLAAEGWIFTLLADDPVYGAYFAATSSAAVTLQPCPIAEQTGTDTSMIAIAVTGLTAASGIGQAHVFIDYYQVDGISDGVVTTTVTINSASQIDTQGKVNI